MFNNIFFLKYKLLAGKLRNDEINESDAVKYFIILSILAGSTIIVPLEFKFYGTMIIPFEAVLSILDFIVTAIINIFAIWYLYHANNQGDGNNFFKRVICLSLPVTIYLILAYYAPISIAMSFLFGKSNTVLYKILSFVMMNTLELVYYFLIYKCLLYISADIEQVPD